MAEVASTTDISRNAVGLRKPPHSVEAEQSLLGGIMLDRKAWDRVADVVADDDFYRADHRLIFRTLARLIDDNQPPDAVTAGRRRGAGLPRGTRRGDAERHEHPRVR